MKYTKPYLFDEVSFWQGLEGYYYMQTSDCTQIKLTKKQTKDLDLKRKLGIQKRIKWIKTLWKRYF